MKALPTTMRQTIAVQARDRTDSQPKSWSVLRRQPVPDEHEASREEGVESL
jgi:hypothetical protein